MNPRRFVRSRSLQAAAVGAMVAAAPFVAAAPAAASPPGAVSFYTTTNYVGLIRSVSYLSCETPRSFNLGRPTGSYDNKPAPGCRVQVSVGLNWYTLCQGRHVMPIAYRDAPTVRITAGSTPLDCINP